MKEKLKVKGDSRKMQVKKLTSEGSKVTLSLKKNAFLKEEI